MGDITNPNEGFGKPMDPALDPERRWDTDNTPITEFNGPTASYIGQELTPEMQDKVNDLLGIDPVANREKAEKDLLVDHPPHYNNRLMEAIDIIEMIIEIEKNPKVAYNMSNVLKYILRFRDKGTPVRDLQKAGWYLNRMIEKVEEELEEAE